jgi:capsid protein
LSTLEEKLGERGLDFEEVVAQRKAERQQLEAAGLNYPVPQNRDAWQPEDDTGTTPRK